MGNLLLIVVPAICKEEGSPFGDSQVCSSVGLSYASFSMAVIESLTIIFFNSFNHIRAKNVCKILDLFRFTTSQRTAEHRLFLVLQLGGFFIWSYTYQLIRTSSMKYKALEELNQEVAKTPNNELDADHQTHLLNPKEEDHLDIIVSSTKYLEDAIENEPAVSTLENREKARRRLLYSSLFLWHIREKTLTFHA